MHRRIHIGRYTHSVLCSAVAICAWWGNTDAWADDARYGTPDEVAVVEDERLPEISGIVASRRHKGFFYVHNDSGNAPEVFLIDRAGTVRGLFLLAGATNVDWEDIAVAPGEDGAFDVCVADIGDNRQRRAEIVVYRFPEPALPSAVADVIQVRPEAFRLHYPDGAHNAEAFVVEPHTGDGYIITKEQSGEAQVYRLPHPWSASQTTKLEHVGALRFPAAAPIETMVTAADVSPDGRRLVTRSYLAGWEWLLPENAENRAFRRIFAEKPARVILAGELQAEAIAYSVDGRCLLTISEQLPSALNEARLVEQP